MSGEAARRALAERVRTDRPGWTAVAEALRTKDTKPVVSYYCSAGGSGGRGGCLLYAVYLAPDATLVLYKPAGRHSEAMTNQISWHERTEAAHADDLALLAQMGGLLHASCRHYNGDQLAPARVLADARAARGRVLLPEAGATAAPFVGRRADRRAR